MSLLSDLIPGSGLLSLASNVIDRFIPDATANAAAKSALIQSQLNGDLEATIGQIKIDEIEAANTNWFVAGWRPFIGWICGCGLGYQFLLMPLGNGLMTVLGHAQPFIALNTDTLLSCLSGLLGLGTLRTFEKHQGVEDNR